MTKVQILELLLAVVFCLSLSSCGKDSSDSSDSTVSESETSEEAAETEETVTAESNTTEETFAEETADDELETATDEESGGAEQPDSGASDQSTSGADAADAEAAADAVSDELDQSYMASLGILNDAGAAALAEENGIVPTTEYFPLDETETISMWYCYPPWMDNDMNERLVFQMFEEATNVHVEFTAVSLAAADSEFQLMIASGDYSDILYQLSYHYKDYELAIDEEIVYDLNGIIQEYCPSYNYLLETFPDYKEGITGESGEYLEFTSFSTSTSSAPESMYIRQDWLDELGLDSPVTYEEMYDVLVAFKNTHDCESAFWLHEDAMTNCLMAGYGITEGYWDEDGTAMCLYTSDGFREYLTMLNQWVEEGLICNDFYAIDSNNDYPNDSYILDGESGIFHLPLTVTSRYVGELGEADKVYLTPICNPRKETDDVLTLHGLDEDEEVTVSIGMGWSISTCCEDIETTARWIDYWYTEDGSMIANYGEEDYTYTYNDEGNPVWTELITNNPDELSINNAIAFYCQFNGGGYFVDEWKTLQTQDLELIATINEKHSNENADNEWPTTAELNVEESEIEVQYEPDVETAASEWILSFIVGNKDINTQWDEYLSVLDDLCIQNIIDCYQASLDRYYETQSE